MRLFILLFLLVMMSGMAPLSAQTEDPYLWLEEVSGVRAMDWVRAQNAESLKIIEAVPGFEETRQGILNVLDSRERIPFASMKGKYLYNFWRDADHPRGVYRRTTLEEYQKDQPAWEVVLDVDQLAREEEENWVYKGTSLLYPDYRHALVYLSRGGADAVVVREFDVETKTFVTGGFELAEAKSNVAWRDVDSLYVGTDFGPGSLTTSGYPRQVKLWKRGTPLAEAETLHEAPASSMSVSAGRMFSEYGHLDFIVASNSFYSRDYYVQQGSRWVRLDLPEDMDLSGYFRTSLLLSPKSDWELRGKRIPGGSILVCSLSSLLAGQPEPQVLVAPKEGVSVQSVDTTRSSVLVTVLDKVVGKLMQFVPSQEGRWRQKEVAVPENGSVSVFNCSEQRDDYFLSYTGFLNPPTVYLVHGQSGRLEQLKSQRAFFDASGYRVCQWEAKSADGTKVPYFVVMADKTEMNGSNPTLLYGYGGFEISMTPSYSGSLGLWLEKGGVYVLANIRGGGEFGPAWHQAALKKNRHKAFEDFIAVAEDLISRKLTSSQHLAIQGGSNGGLLVGAVSVRRPDLFAAAVCQVPLLDMRRYTKLLAGASWAAEYGDPDDPDMWEYIKTYSPYHNVKKGVRYPVIFFTTSTRDDRVHPAHARKMVARMKEQGHRVLYFENIEGGHGGAANNAQRARMSALGYSFLFDTLWTKGK